VHIEFLSEDSSGAKLLGFLLPRLLGESAEPHTWRIHSYKGVGRIPPGLKPGDARKRILLDQLPRLLRGYSRTPGIDAVVVVLDSDRKDCRAFLDELTELADACTQPLGPFLRTRTMPILFRLAIEETEAWYLGDREALAEAYPAGRWAVLDGYEQDAVCGTWERLADAVHPGGHKAVQQAGWPRAGDLKHQWAEQIGPHLVPDRNVSPSFGKLRSGLLRLISET
jgi:hypothetical protein